MSEPRGAKLHEPPVICATKGCGKRLTVAAVTGGSKHCSRQHAGYLLPSEKPGYKYGSGADPGAPEPSDADLEGSGAVGQHPGSLGTGDGRQTLVPRLWPTSW